MILSEQQLRDLCCGAAFLGTGGGGDPYVGMQLVLQAMREGCQVEIISPEELPDDGLVIPTAMMGAPTVMLEKLPRGDEAVKSLQRIEQFLGKRACATMPIEVGGINSTMPLVVGARLGIPIVDADGMGRAFPELYMETFHVYGVKACPMVVSNEHGDTVLLETMDNHRMEWLARGVTVRMGGHSNIAVYPMTKEQVIKTAIPNTLHMAMNIGQCLRKSQERHLNPFKELFAYLKTTDYSFAADIFQGKVMDVQRHTDGGFVRGKTVIQGLDNYSGTLEVSFQNENLVAMHDGKVKAIVPDLICILDSETAVPITTEGMRYGQRVRVIGVSAHPIMRTPQALEAFGPKVFGLDHPYVPLAELLAQ